MLQTSARLLRLLTTLQARRSWSGRELAARLEVTERTLRRDVDRLRSLGYPVQSTSGVAGGYTLGAGASLPPLMLDDAEGLAVMIALEHVAASGVVGVEGAAQRALTKLGQVLPARLRKKLAALRASIVRVPSSVGPELEAVSALADACAQSVEARFDYRDYRGAATRRHVEPQRIVLMGRQWYLVAYDLARNDFRTFRVDRIALPIETGKPFVPRRAPDDDLAAYVQRAVSSAPYVHTARVILHAPLATVQRQISPGSGVLTAIDSTRCRFEPGANTLEGLAVWLGMLGFDFEVEHPPELVAHVRRAAERLHAASARTPSRAARRSKRSGPSSR